MNLILLCVHYYILINALYIELLRNFFFELVVSCGGETLQTFLHRAGGIATYTSKMAVVTWVEESLLKRLHKAPFF